MEATTPPREFGEITRLLREASHGNREAFDALLRLVYAELNQLAHLKLRLEPAGHTLDTAGLVHEAYLKLVDQTRVEWSNRHQFFGVASEAMRRILVDYAKRRNAGKRGGGARHVPLDAVENQSPAAFLMMTDEQSNDLVALDDALTRLEQFNPQGARIVQYRFFGGLSIEEVAQMLGVSERTVRRSWTAAKAWLRSEIGSGLLAS